MSNEHIWSKWSWPYFETPKADSHSRGSYEALLSDFSTPIKDDVSQRQGDAWNFRINVVCQTCNNEWMSHVDEQAKCLLAPMMGGTGTRLEAENQRRLATWMTMKSMVMEYRDGRESKSIATPQLDRTYLFRNKTPPPNGWEIWIGKATGPLWHKFYYRAAATLASVPLLAKVDRGDVNVPKNTQTVCLGIGQVFFYAYQSTHGILKIPPGFRERVERIWPTGPSFDWPPKVLMTDDDAFRASTILPRFATKIISSEG